MIEPPESEKKPWSSFRGDRGRNAGFVQGPGGSVELAESLRDLVQKFPKSVYSDYARYALGRYYVNSGQYDEGLAMFEELLKVRPEFPLGVEVRYYIGRANYLKGIKAFQDLSGQYPNWVGSRQAERVLLHGVDP